MGKRIRAVIGSQGGYALVAAMLIMLLITALGVLAMVTSSSEQTITTNLGESQMMFYHAEQAVDRILSHLAYLQGGLFSKVSGLGFDPTQSGNELSPSHVLDNKAVLYRVSSTIDASSIYRIDAWLDPKDFECSSDEDPCPKSVDRGLSRPVAVSVMVTNNRTGATKAFRFYARPRAAWDFAYYALNNNPTDRVNSNLAGENCSAASYTWYTCQSTMMSGDRVVGDVYISNSTMTPSDGIVAASPDTGRFFVRGAPQLLGEVRWRSPLPFDMGTYSGGVFTNSRNQTHGGSLTSAQPKAALGMKYYSRPVNMPARRRKRSPPPRPPMPRARISDTNCCYSAGRCWVSAASASD